MMPEPRQPVGPDPFKQIGDDVSADVDLNIEEAKSWASGEVKRWLPVVEDILEESEHMLPLNPSASVVWSVQALEVFLKKGVLGPTLRVRLGFDSKLADELFEKLIGHKGTDTAKEWLGRLVRLPEQMMRSGSAAIWSTLFSEQGGIVKWRNEIVHGGAKASQREAEDALQNVRNFITAVDELLEPPPGSVFG